MNKKNSLVHVDLSNNHLDDKGKHPLSVAMVISGVYLLGFEILGQALEGLPHGLVTFSLANTGLSSRAASILSGAMIKNSHCASSLTKLANQMCYSDVTPHLTGWTGQLTRWDQTLRLH